MSDLENWITEMNELAQRAWPADSVGRVWHCSYPAAVHFIGNTGYQFVLVHPRAVTVSEFVFRMLAMPADKSIRVAKMVERYLATNIPESLERQIARLEAEVKFYEVERKQLMEMRGVAPPYGAMNSQALCTFADEQFAEGVRVGRRQVLEEMADAQSDGARETE